MTLRGDLDVVGRHHEHAGAGRHQRDDAAVREVHVVVVEDPVGEGARTAAIGLVLGRVGVRTAAGDGVAGQVEDQQAGGVVGRVVEIDVGVLRVLDLDARDVLDGAAAAHDDTVGLADVDARVRRAAHLRVVDQHVLALRPGRCRRRRACSRGRCSTRRGGPGRSRRRRPRRARRRPSGSAPARLWITKPSASARMPCAPVCWPVKSSVVASATAAAQHDVRRRHDHLVGEREVARRELDDRPGLRGLERRARLELDVGSGHQPHHRVAGELDPRVAGRRPEGRHERKEEQDE